MNDLGIERHQQSCVFDGLRIGLGCMALTGIYGPVDPRDAIATIHRALDFGITHFDTAELYGPYRNEELLAAALGSSVKHVRIATKFGYRLDGNRIAGLDSRPETMRRAVEGSLRRLRRESIDLLYQHRQDPNVPVEDVVGAMSELVKAGYVQALGLSAVDAVTLERARAVHEIHAVQNEYSLLCRRDDATLPSVLAPNSISFVAYSPLARGLLAGGARGRSQSDYRRSDVRFGVGAWADLQTRLAPLWTIAKQRDVAPSVVALAWILQKAPGVFIIPGARTPSQIETSIQAAAFHLSRGEYTELEAIEVPSTSEILGASI
jgi:aryl-alcohol dehydrogenase-like predicted oxidoreductase